MHGEVNADLQNADFIMLNLYTREWMTLHWQHNLIPTVILAPQSVRHRLNYYSYSWLR